MTPAPQSTSMENAYQEQRYFYQALEPIHVGAGGYRLGRVDMTIVREPGTNLPKIPGTALSGAARSYAAMLYGKPEAAGAHGNFMGDKKKCPIVWTFGTATDAGGGQAGTVSIGDAQLVFFPVSTLAGCVLVTCKRALTDAGLSVPETWTGEDEYAMLYSDYSEKLIGLNLGWLWFEKDRVRKWDRMLPGGPFGAEKFCIVADSLFAHVVNSNLEVRTSVVINHETGAAEDGLLFSYEAVPRGAWLCNRIVLDEYRKFNGEQFTPVTHQFNRAEKKKETWTGQALPAKRGGETRNWNGPLDVVASGLELMEHLGVGGMGTRGFGRLKAVQA